jgi:hypothetical protein
MRLVRSGKKFLRVIKFGKSLFSSVSLISNVFIYGQFDLPGLFPRGKGEEQFLR